MAIRSIGANHALQQNNHDSAEKAESQSSASIHSASTLSIRKAAVGSPTKRSQPSRSMRRWLLTGYLGLVVIGSGGCMMTSGICRSFSNSDCIDEFMISYRNKAMAEKAWHCRKDQFCNERHNREFKAGFIEGYIEVASGGNGCTPAVAPNEYWGWRYQSANGHGAVNAWFQGYPQGVRAAEEDGVGNWSQMRAGGGYAPTPTSTMQPGPIAPMPIDGSSPMGGPIMSSPSSEFGGTNPFYADPQMQDAPAMGTPLGGSSQPVEAEVIEMFDGVSLETPSDFEVAEVMDGQGPASEEVASDAIDFIARGVDGVQASFGDNVSTVVESATDVNIDEVFGKAVAPAEPTPSSKPASDELPFSFE